MARHRGGGVHRRCNHCKTRNTNEKESTAKQQVIAAATCVTEFNDIAKHHRSNHQRAEPGEKHRIHQLTARADG